MNKWGIGLTFLLAATSVMAKDIQLLNISYDPTRELYKQYNKAFSTHWKQQTGNNMVIHQSHSGSGKQATSVINSIEADVVTLALAYDMDTIAEHRQIDKEWIKHLPDNSTPYTSTIVFLVHKGNPKQIHDWNNLIKPGVSVITPNPKSSGGTHWNYLAAWGYTLHHNNNNQAKAQDFVQALYKNIKVLDSGAHSSTNTFVKHRIGNVLITWENKALLAANELGKDKFKIITPSESILAEPTMSVVNKVVKKKGTKEVAEAYLKYLYSPEGQEIATKNYYHPRDAEVAKKYKNAFPKLKLFTIDEEFSSWTKAQKEHFANSSTFNQISKH